MALSFDDKILGEKVDYYCSSSEDEGDNECKVVENSDVPDLNTYNGHSANTGPKGVIEDWRKFKQQEIEMREDAMDKYNLARKINLTCRTNREDIREKDKDEEFLNEIEDQLDEMDDDYLRQYRLKRIECMRNATVNSCMFGNLKEVNKSEFLEVIDMEHSTATVVIVHIYKKGLKACAVMNSCLECLASQYPMIKFCKLDSTIAQLSVNFCMSGVPTLLAYKKGELIGNFVRLTDEFGDEFFATDVEGFLIEHAILPDNLDPIKQNSSIRSSGRLNNKNRNKNNEDDDDDSSDYDLD